MSLLSFVIAQKRPHTIAFFHYTLNTVVTFNPSLNIGNKGSYSHIAIAMKTGMLNIKCSLSNLHLKNNPN